MTHTLHREGSEDTLKDDFPFLVTPVKGINDKGALRKLQRIIDIIFEVGPANYGGYEKGNIFTGVTAEEVKKAINDRSRPRCLFSNREKLKEVLRRLVKENFGISITVSGLISEIERIARELDIKPHSINLSLGIHGKREYLPDEDIREITTMCGHGMVAPNLVKDMLLKVKKGEKTVEEAGIELAKPCVCGVFNQERASGLLSKMSPFWCRHTY
ncbi:hypothetical protein J7K55_00555 [Candidatus Aerophobetes bacterium]|nr:hypothetical protein [Candidatus Aerophobetes bacterium]